eukprot:6645626-Prymnesium_polylepis.1
MPRRSDPNHCTAEEILPLSVARPRRGVEAVPQTPAGQVRPARPPRTEALPIVTGEEDDDGDAAPLTRLHDKDAKLAIFRAYHEWAQAGRKHADSPIDDL